MISRCWIDKIRLLVPEYTELVGIAAPLLMMVISCVPLYSAISVCQISVASYFFAIFLIRIVIWLWKQHTPQGEKSVRAYAKMMLFSGITLLFAHTTFLVAVIYQVLLRKDVPFMASAVLPAILYGLYAFARAFLSIRGLALGWKNGIYQELRAYIDWVSALYTSSLFTEYILTATGNSNLKWPKYLIISIAGVTVFALAVFMVIRSVRILRDPSR